MPCKIINNSGLEIPGFEDMIQSLVSFSQDRFGFEKPPTLFLNSDPANAENMLGKTAYYDPEQREIHVYTTDRHPKDIMRSISHELVHHNQNCQGNLGGDHYSGEGYAQKDPHMRKMEKEAYLQGNMCFRDWEDGYKQEQQVYNEWRTNTMSLKEWKNKELFGLLSQKWGFSKNVINEGKKEFKVEDGPGKGDENFGVTPGGKLEPNPNPKYENKQLEEQNPFGDPEEIKKEIGKLRAAGKEAEAKKMQDALNQMEKSGYFSLEEEKLDEEEIEEGGRAHVEKNADYFTERDQDRIRESIYNKFKKLIK